MRPRASCRGRHRVADRLQLSGGDAHEVSTARSPPTGPTARSGPRSSAAERFRDGHPVVGGGTMTVLINQSYRRRGSRVNSGTHARLRIGWRRRRSFDVLRPEGLWASSTLWVWAWVQCVLPLRARGATVLSLTSRAPLWRRRHVLVVHDLFVLTNPEWFSRRYIWTHAPLLRAQIPSAAAVVAVSGPDGRCSWCAAADAVRGGPERTQRAVRDRPQLPDDQALRRLGLERRGRTSSLSGAGIPQEPRAAGGGLRSARPRGAPPIRWSSSELAPRSTGQRSWLGRRARSRRATSPTTTFASSTGMRAPWCW